MLIEKILAHRIYMLEMYAVFIQYVYFNLLIVALKTIFNDRLLVIVSTDKPSLCYLI